MNDRIKQLLKELGNAINESISASAEVNEQIQKIRDEGYNLYVMLDATIGLNREDEDHHGENIREERSAGLAPTDVRFRIDINDLNFLRSVGIDPTRRVRSTKKLEGKIGNGEEQQ